MMRFGDLARLVKRSEQVTPELIQKAMMGALGELHQKRGDGQPLDVVWTAPRPGRVAARIVTRDANGTRYLSHFSGDGKAKAAAVLVLWTLCKSALGHAEGSEWAGTARDLAAEADEMAKAEGLL